MSGEVRPGLRVAIAGLGAVGWPVAQKLDDGIEGLELVAVAVRRPGPAREKLSTLRRPPALVMPGDLAALGDVVVECVPAAVFDQVARPAVEAGRIFVPISVGALLGRDDLVARARATGGRSHSCLSMSACFRCGTFSTCRFSCSSSYPPSFMYLRCTCTSERSK